ncbi:TadE/TadG family type IV pilus assembly protein [Tardiphaga sp.]|uniref:TadE/TadG family type IV pilus assembly protein n=1 Tax=Tardiphaga sp. TaxID=1926292 RepID=UPI002636EADB|nr:TadE/TadG family type IV pilus assembly protein [Tardiphaga sp.]MDB5618650.1 TadE-like [Tardiphaga sp.]
MSRVPALCSRFPRLLARLYADTRGIAAVEFAMIMPLLMVMFFGMIDVSMGVGADRKVTMIAQTMADLASRYTKVVDADFTNFFSIGDAMLTPFAPGDLTATISQVYIDPTTGTGKVYWSKGDAVRSLNSSVTVPAGLIGKDSSGNVLANQYLIFAEVKYAYKPIIGYVVPKAGLTLSETTYARPRQSTCVDYVTAGTCK